MIRVRQLDNNVVLEENTPSATTVFDIIMLIPSRAFRVEPEAQFVCIHDTELNRTRNIAYTDIQDEAGVTFTDKDLCIEYLAKFVSISAGSTDYTPLFTAINDSITDTNTLVTETNTLVTDLTANLDDVEETLIEIRDNTNLSVIDQIKRDPEHTVAFTFLDTANPETRRVSTIVYASATLTLTATKTFSWLGTTPDFYIDEITLS
jgi:hypothetical protein